MKYDWTVSSLVIIFSALFALSALSEPEETKPSNDENGAARTEKVKDESNELEMIKAEFSVFRHQLSEVLLKSEKQNKEFVRIENSAASMLSGMEISKEGEEYRRLLESYVALCGAAEKIISKVVDLDSFSEEVLGKETPEKLDKVRIRCKLDELVSETEKLKRLLKPPFDGEIHGECAISAVNVDLQIVVLDVGFADSMICGLVCMADGGGGKKTVLKIVALRPFVSAAIVIEGDIMDLLPGMKVKIGNKNGN